MPEKYSTHPQHMCFPVWLIAVLLAEFKWVRKVGATR